MPITNEYKLTKIGASTKSFAVKDLITVSISIFALLLSLTNFYFTVLRVEDKFQASVISEGLETSRDSYLGDYAVKIVFNNLGNRQAMLLEAGI